MSTLIQAPVWLQPLFTNANAKPAWLGTYQQKQADHFFQRGLPTRREEFWKYTDVSYLEKQNFKRAEVVDDAKIDATIKAHRLANTDSILFVFVNGYFSETYSDLSLLPQNVLLGSLQKVMNTHEEIIKPYLMTVVNLHRHPFCYLNSALLTDGLFLQLPRNVCVKTPIHLLFLNTGSEAFLACSRNIVIAGENSEAVLFEEHIGLNDNSYFSNLQTDIHAGSNAKIEYYKVQGEGSKATHIAQTFVHQKQDSRVLMCALQFGARLDRDEISVELLERGAECSINGFYGLNQDEQHIDNHIQIDHIAPHGTSHMMYKGILDRKSHGVFNGKIHVLRDAQKTQSNQANHNLLLSKEAQIDTKPEFEIYADDVKCAHGDTVGQMDNEALFYLRARGIDKDTAFKMLTRAFADEVMDRILHPAIASRMNELLNEMLSHDN